jgi:hypothetical protein
MRSPPPPRWSKKTDELVRYVAERCRPGLRSELGHWAEDRPRFGALLAANRDKIRKKLTTAHDEAARLDVRAELLVAYVILAERRFEVAFEAYGASRLGPDLTVVYRGNQRFNLEVTRVRSAGQVPGQVVSEGAGEPSGAPESARLANVIAAKVRQLPGEMPNALVMTGHGLAVSAESLAAAVRLLKLRADQHDDKFFVGRGLKDARTFYARYLRLSGVFVVDEASLPGQVIFLPNREARYPLPREILTRLTACLTAGVGAAPSSEPRRVWA